MVKNERVKNSKFEVDLSTFQKTIMLLILLMSIIILQEVFSVISNGKPTYCESGIF